MAGIGFGAVRAPLHEGARLREAVALRTQRLAARDGGARARGPAPAGRLRGGRPRPRCVAAAPARRPGARSSHRWCARRSTFSCTRPSTGSRSSPHLRHRPSRCRWWHSRSRRPRCEDAPRAAEGGARALPALLAGAVPRRGRCWRSGPPTSPPATTTGGPHLDGQPGGRVPRPRPGLGSRPAVRSARAARRHARGRPRPARPGAPAFRDSLDREDTWYAHLSLALIASQEGKKAQAAARNWIALTLNREDRFVSEAFTRIRRGRKLDPAAFNKDIEELNRDRFTRPDN